MKRALLPFGERPFDHEPCPKCGFAEGWEPRYDLYDHPDGYIGMVDSRRPQEHLCWSCKTCGYFVSTTTKEAVE